MQDDDEAEAPRDQEDLPTESQIADMASRLEKEADRLGQSRSRTSMGEHHEPPSGRRTT